MVSHSLCGSRSPSTDPDRELVTLDKGATKSWLMPVCGLSKEDDEDGKVVAVDSGTSPMLLASVSSV
jgi:hypothetical protein